MAEQSEKSLEERQVEALEKIAVTLGAILNRLTEWRSVDDARRR